MNSKIDNLFGSANGKQVYRKIVSYISKQGIDKELGKGVLLGLSGGADSVFLLAFLLFHREKEGYDFPILCCHVNHGIRGEEAERDERFAASLSSELGVEFISHTLDVPRLAKESSIGIEEAAREARYSVFNYIISGRNDISTIAVAHNATDNCETVVFNLSRGSGTNGVSGIKPIRDNIVRPILSVSKSEIISLLDECGIAYVTDSTNSDCCYTRNYIRHRILPLFENLNPSYEDAFCRMSENLRQDMDYISSVAEAEYARVLKEGRIFASDLLSMHVAVRARVLTLFCRECAEATLSKAHIDAILELIENDNFSYSISGEYNFVCERGVCYFAKKQQGVKSDFIQRLSAGYNSISGYNCDVYIGRTDEFSSNIYNFSIQTKISSAIINKDPFFRFRKEADAYRYGNMTHKLKKVFNDREIPASVRDLIPIICDEGGIAWVPGLSVRDGLGDARSEYIIAVCLREPNSTDTQIFIPNKSNVKKQI